MANQSDKALWTTGAIIIFFVAALITNGFGLFSPSSPGIPLEIGNSPVLGDPNAKIIIYEFSDFSCPFCSAAEGYDQALINKLKQTDKNWEAPLPKIKEEYVKTGKVKIVFKYLAGHGTAEAAHKVGWCLNDQNLFWEFHEAAFKNQQDTYSTEKMKSLAISLGANANLLNSCLESKKYDYMIESDKKMADSKNIQGTPSFIIGNKKIEGAVSYIEFKKIIDSML